MLHIDPQTYFVAAGIAPHTVRLDLSLDLAQYYQQCQCRTDCLATCDRDCCLKIRLLCLVQSVRIPHEHCCQYILDQIQY